ncbi:MAG: winged helix-turn-helix domain-containing protein, partial [Acetobacteraceae bacterium]|nr:winged helix-turn-helix domain-containing protein [Acetobacteraceae bacterium]
RGSGRVMSRAALLDAIAGREAEAFDRTIDVYVGRLRRKIEENPRQPRLILTVPGIGYRLATKRRPEEWALRAGADILAAFNRAGTEHDVGALASLYSRDAVLIRSREAFFGRAKIAAGTADLFKSFIPDPSELERATVVADDVILRSGSWSGTYHDETGPVHLRGWWTTTDVREGATWKIRTETSIRSARPGPRPPGTVDAPRELHAVTRAKGNR